jgi:ribonuclease HIII
MNEQELHKLMEIQYLKGRLDELHKAFPTIIDLHRSRKLDARIQKYYDKLKQTDEIAYHLYLVERYNQQISKQKSQNNIKELLESIIPQLGDMELINKIKNQISKY